MKNLLVISNYNSYYVHTRFINYITNKTNNYIISSDLNLENRLNYSRLRQNKDSDKFSTCKATYIQSKINKANNYYRGGYILFIYPYQLNQIIVTSINFISI